MVKGINRLGPATVRSVGAGLHPDGAGLYLQCTVGTGGGINRSWVFRFTRDGRERRMGLGKYRGDGAKDDVTLAKARDKAAECRLLVAGGIDPIGHRDAERRIKAEEVVTFRKAFVAFYAVKRQSLSNAKHVAQWQSTMETYVYPTIGYRPVGDVTSDEILSVLSPIWFAKPETAKRVLQRIEAVFKSAILRGHRERASPCVGVAQELGTRHRKVAHHASLPYAELPAFLKRLQACNSWPATKLAFEWLTLTATRSGETRLARWSEIDEALWVIPAERTKAKRQHIVPLSPRCLEILRALRAVYPHEPSDLLFPSMKAAAPLSDMTLTKVLRDMGLADKATAHGFRSSFKVWCAEVAKTRDEVSEAALAHAIPEKVRAAYLRTAFLEERKPLMALWAKFCSEPVPSDKVVPIRASG
jgi:integrase